MAEATIATDISLSENSVFIPVSVGDRFKLHRPIGYKGVAFDGGDAKQYLHGFKILFPKLGEFESLSSNTNGSWVIYAHKQSGKQIIEFTSAELGLKKFHLVAETVSVHDHASIAMGGPAFATYYSEPPEEEGS